MGVVVTVIPLPYRAVVGITKVKECAVLRLAYGGLLLFIVMMSLPFDYVLTGEEDHVLFYSLFPVCSRVGAQ